MTLALMAALALGTGCVGDGIIRLRGRVVDGAGRPIPGAAIAISRRDLRFSGTTDSNGCFSVGHLIGPGHYTYTAQIAAPDHQPVTGKIYSLEDNIAQVRLVEVGSMETGSFELLGKEDGSCPR